MTDPYVSSGGRLSRTATLLALTTLLGALPAFAAPGTRNVQALEELARRFQARYDAQRAVLEAAQLDHPVFRAYRDDPNYVIVGVDADGRPIIHKFDGIRAAHTISSDDVRGGGPAGGRGATP